MNTAGRTEPRSREHGGTMILEHRIEGAGQDRATLVFLHGWPDDGRLWQALGTRLVAAGYRCIYVTMPAFPTSEHALGCDFPELAKRLRATLAQLRIERVTMIGHDWGAFLAYVYEAAFPDTVQRLVTLDVGGHFKASGLRHALFVVSYQWWLIGAWLIGKLVPSLGNAMTRTFARLAGAPRPDEIEAKANYPYAYLWRALLVPIARPVLQRYRPTRPLLYLFGNSKPFMFHSGRWLDIVEGADGSQVVPVEDAQHWLMVDQPDVVGDTIEHWLAG